MDDLAQFLAARYDEAEASAKAAIPGPWTLDEWTGGFGRTASVMVPFGPAAPDAKTGLTSLVQLGTQDYETARHIAANDPAHRLADIKLKRAILALHEHRKADTKDRNGPDFGCGICHEDRDYGIIGYGWCATVRHLATEFASHAGYRAEWAP